MRSKLAGGGEGIAVCALVVAFAGYAIAAPKTPPKTPFAADQAKVGATAAQPFANNNGQVPPASQ